MSSPRDVALYFGGTLLTQITAFGTGVLVARWLGPADYGALSLARNVYAAMLILAPLGLDLSLLRHLGENSDDWPGSLAQVRRLRLIAAAVNLAVLAITVLAVAPYLAVHVYRYPHFALYLDLTMTAFPFAADVAILTACLRALGSVDLQNIAALYVQPIVRVLALAGMVALGFGVGGVASSTAFGAAASCLLMSGAIGHVSRRRGIAPRPIGAADETAIRRVMGYSGWLAVMMFLYGVLRSVDVLVLGRFRPAAQVGEYAALSTIAYTIQIFPSALGQTLAPKVARLYTQRDMTGMRELLSGYLRNAVLLSSPLFAGIAVFGPWLDLVFGKRYHFTSSLSLNLSLVFLISGCLGQMGASLTMTGRHRTEFWILVLGTLLALGLCLLLGPPFGGNGVALGVTAGYIFTNAVRTIISARFMGGLDVSLKDAAPPLALLAAAYAWRALLDHTAPHTLLVGAFAALGLLGIFGAIYWSLLLKPPEKEWVAGRISRLGRRVHD